MDKISVRDARQAAAIGRQATLEGWIRTRRDSKGGFSFLELNDGSSLANMQVVVDGKLPNYDSEARHLSPGCSVTVRGEDQAVRRQGAGHRNARDGARRARLGRPRGLSAAEEASHA